jgi:hypothetical protein
MAEEKKKSAAKAATPADGMNRDEQVGFHKGALNTLVKERQELGRLLQIVEQLMQMHVTALKDLGIDLQKQAEELVKKAEKDKKPIEDILR